MSDINKTNGGAENTEAAEKTAAKKTAAKKTSEKKTAEKKTATRKTAEKKTTAKKTAEKPAEKSTAKKAAKKEPEKKRVNEKLIEALEKWEKNPFRENLNAVMEEGQTGKFWFRQLLQRLTEEESRRVGSGQGRRCALLLSPMPRDRSIFRLSPPRISFCAGIRNTRERQQF